MRQHVLFHIRNRHHHPHLRVLQSQLLNNRPGIYFVVFDDGQKHVHCLPCLQRKMPKKLLDYTLAAPLHLFLW
ncbi:hypothetical protein GCM10028895_31660 [Pontibacter rugosus]